MEVPFCLRGSQTKWPCRGNKSLLPHGHAPSPKGSAEDYFWIGRSEVALKVIADRGMKGRM